jgi:Family of unknown function (DUF5681)
MSNPMTDPQDADAPDSRDLSDAAAPEDDCAVGYRRPPVRTRFKPGVSGNPCGRPKAPKSAGKSLKDAMARYMTVVENGKKRKVRAQELIMQSLVNDAARGKPHAVKMLFSLADRYTQNDEHDIDPASFAADDLAVINNYLVSIQAQPDSRVDAGRKDATAPEKTDDQAADVANQRRG